MKAQIIILLILILMAGCSLERSNPLDPVENEVDVPDPVIGINVTHPNSQQIVITWATQEDADGYYIYRSMSVDGYYARIDGELLNTQEADNFTDEEIISGNWYYYKMSAYRWVEGRKLEGWRSGPKTW